MHPHSTPLVWSSSPTASIATSAKPQDATSIRFDDTRVPTFGAIGRLTKRSLSIPIPQFHALFDSQGVIIVEPARQRPDPFIEPIKLDLLSPLEIIVAQPSIIVDNITLKLRTQCQEVVMVDASPMKRQSRLNHLTIVAREEGNVFLPDAPAKRCVPSPHSRTWGYLHQSSDWQCSF